MDEMEKRSARERLILAGIDEVENHGLQNFSIRRIATACELSCAAPYKHFKDKLEFVTAITDFVYDRWGEERTRIMAENEGDTRRQLVKISVGYIRFLHENPSFRSIIMLRDIGQESGERQMLLRMTDGARDLVDRYCREVNMPPDDQWRKTFVVRSLIYGAALMMDNGEISEERGDLDVVEAMIDREFDLE